MLLLFFDKNGIDSTTVSLASLLNYCSVRTQLLPFPDGTTTLTEEDWQHLLGLYTGISVTDVSDVSVGLTGIQITSALGTLVSDLSVSLTGQEVVATLGTMGVDITVTLTGTEVATEQGTVLPVFSTTVALTGIEIASAQGTLAVATTIELTGQEITVSQGTIGTTGGVVVEFSGLDVYYDGSVVSLSLVPEAAAPAGMGGKMKLSIDGTIYAVYLVETDDARASRVHVATSTGVKAIRLKL